MEKELLYYSLSPVRTFVLPPPPYPAGPLALQNLRQETISVDPAWAAPLEIPFEQAQSHLEAGAMEAFAVLRQIYEAARLVHIQETGEDPSVELTAARDEALQDLDGVQERVDEAFDTLRTELRSGFDEFMSSMGELWSEFSQVMESDEGKAALRMLGQKLSALGEEE